MASSGGGGDPWAWLGLLKWSLSYSDGTRDSSEDMVPMSQEDREFLEKVMKEGIIDENERMKTILVDATAALDYYQRKSTNKTGADEEEPPISDDDLEELLQELRDIVEQIDYARAFCSLKGVPFVLGCASETEAVPESIRNVCLGILATICQNNPPVQKELLEIGALKTLSDLFFHESSTPATQARVIQAISACVRNHHLAEGVFCQLEQASALLTLGVDPKTSTALRSKTLFFLRALVTSDSTSQSRIRIFTVPIVTVADHYLQEINPPDLRESGLSMLVQILEQAKSVDAVLSRKDALAGLGVQRISSLRGLSGEDREYAQEELSLWERLMQLLARAEPDTPESSAPAPEADSSVLPQ